MIGGVEDAVVVDGGYVGVGCRLGQEVARSQKYSCGLCAEASAIDVHVSQTLGGRIPP